MIVRIVKMTFKPESVEQFLEIFNTYKQYIQGSEGCLQLELLNDINSKNIFFTHSHWKNEESLNNYRNSALFEKVWSNTKVLFETKAEAWSLTKVK